jgi:hypothetical protein
MQNVNIILLTAAEYVSLETDLKSRFTSDYASRNENAAIAKELPQDSGVIPAPVDSVRLLFQSYDHLVVADNDRIYGSKRSTYIYIFHSKGLFLELKNKFPGNMEQVKKIFLT